MLHQQKSQLSLTHHQKNIIRRLTELLFLEAIHRTVTMQYQQTYGLHVCESNHEIYLKTQKTSKTEDCENPNLAYTHLSKRNAN